MNAAFLMIGIVIVICILMDRFVEKLPIPPLLVFIALGMCFGENGLLRIPFNDYEAVNLICSASLVFIMFYGGFGTNLKAARPVAAPAVVLSTLGVAGTAGAVGLFAHFALKLPWLESLLIGSVISSTDAATVFNILRSKKLALKNHTDSLLEVESGSNDPMSYMLTTVLIALMSGQQVSIPLLLVQQLVLGALAGVLVGRLAVWLLGKNLFDSQQSRTVFLFGVVLLSYALPSICNGNGYLSVYLCGILLGNAKLSQKKYLVHFFDVVTGVAQVIIFFLLGLLVTPVELPQVLLPALAVMAFLTVLARPVVTSVLLLPFRPTVGQLGVVSWAGLRGAASIVFAISAVLSGVDTTYNLYNLVFCIVLLSMLIQGTLLPRVAGRLSMIDEHGDVSKTFTDYQEESDISFIKIHLGPGHPWRGRALRELMPLKDLLVVMVVRGERTIVPNGDTRLEEGDLLVLAAYPFEEREHLRLSELTVERGHRLANRTLADIASAPNSPKYLIVLIQRGQETVIPTGSTVILPGDVLILALSEGAKPRTQAGAAET